MKASDYTFPGMEHQDIRVRLADAVDKLETIASKSGGTAKSAGPLADLLDEVSARLRLIEYVAPVLPGAPTSLVVTPASTSLSGTWAAPASDGGSPITSYKVWLLDAALEVAQGPIDVDDLVLTYEFTGLTPSTQYTFFVYATNAIGTEIDGAFSTVNTLA